MDPLTALRDYAIRGELDRIVRVGDDLRFGDEFSFPARSETAFRSKQGSFYTLDSLLFFLRHQHLKHTDYLQSSRLNRLPSVTFPDRVPLLDYLLGRSSSSDQIASPPRSEPPEPAARLATPLPPPPIDYLSMIRALERPLKDRDALLECRSRDFHSLLLASSRREDDRSRVAPDRDPAPNSTPKPKMQKVGEGVPIIFVPSAFQTLITIYNVKEFLEDGVFVPTESKVKGAAAKPECVTVRKKLSRDRAVAAYEVRDKAAALRKEDWERVVAVFVLGKEWQFKDWPFKDHVEIFNKIIGFYVRFEDDSLESAKLVKQWNVKIISISKNRRHQDRAAALEVWERLEAFMCSKSHT